MRKMNAYTLAAALAAGLLTTVAQPALAQVTAYEGARLIDGRGGSAVENATIVVDGAKIVSAGANVAVPAGATRVNLAGKTVMPMILDTHVHLTNNREGLIRDLKQRAYYGIAAAQSMGTNGFNLLAVRNETVPGGARYFSAGRGMSRPEPGRDNTPYWVDTEDQARTAVRELAANKVDLVKIWVDDRNGMYPKLTPALYGAIIDEAHKNNLRVMAHIFTMEDGKGLIKAGVDAFAHSVRDKDIDDEYLTLLRSHSKLIVNPNLPDRGVKTDVTWLKASLSPEAYAKVEAENTDNARAQTAYGIQARNLAKNVAAGVTIILGEDGNTSYGPHIEMEDMVVAGMTPMQVIVSGTKNAAEFLRIADTNGTIEAGKSADLLVLDANPLDDITNTRKISRVFLRGQQLDRSKLPQ